MQLNEESFGNLQDTLNLTRVMASEKLNAFLKNCSMPACSTAQALKKGDYWFTSFKVAQLLQSLFYEIRGNVNKWTMCKAEGNGMSR